MFSNCKSRISQQLLKTVLHFGSSQYLKPTSIEGLLTVKEKDDLSVILTFIEEHELKQKPGKLKSHESFKCNKFLYAQIKREILRLPDLIASYKQKRVHTRKSDKVRKMETTAKRIRDAKSRTRSNEENTGNRKRHSYTPNQLDVLEKCYAKTRCPDNDTIRNIAIKIKVPMMKLKIWFLNRRYRYSRYLRPTNAKPMCIKSDPDMSVKNEFSGRSRRSSSSPPSEIKPTNSRSVLGEISNTYSNNAEYNSILEDMDTCNLINSENLAAEVMDFITTLANNEDPCAHFLAPSINSSETESGWSN